MTHDKGVTSSSVKGIPISFDVGVLGKNLDIHSEGLKIKRNTTFSLTSYVKKEFYNGIARLAEHEFFQKRKKMISGKLPERNYWSTMIFYINDRLLHYILGYIILPKFSNHSIVLDTKMKLLFSIMIGLQVNWENVII